MERGEAESWGREGLRVGAEGNGKMMGRGEDAPVPNFEP